MPRPTIRNDDSRSTVLRAVRLLEVFSAKDTELSLSQIVERSGTPKTSAHRLVSDLVQGGMLERGAYGYRLGLKLFELGHLVPSQRHLRDVALPYLEDLHSATQLTVNLAIRDGDEVVYVEKLVQRNTKVPHTRSGGRLPLHCTALGKAILAFCDQDFCDGYTSRPLTSLTRYSITDPAALREALAEIRHSHIALDNQESQLGLYCVASPVTGYRGQIGAISVTGATRPDQAHQMASAVLVVARALSRSLSRPGFLPVSAAAAVTASEE